MFNTRKKYEKFRFDVKTKYSYNIYAPVYNYAEFNNRLSMPLFGEHGVYMFDYIETTDLKQKPKFVLVFSERRRKAWETQSKIPAAVFGAPFVRYRHMEKIAQSPEAKGTIAFPAHSVPLDCLDFEFDWVDYCNTLKTIPAGFHPVDICMHPNDISSGFGKICEDQGFKVVSASSHNPRQDFMQNFYEILKQYKYSTSNEISSSAFYAVELGLPFFLLGKYPTYIMHEEGWGIPKGVTNELTDPVYKLAEKMFPHEPTSKISNELKEYVDSELGVYDCISPDELYKIIIKYYNQHLFKRFLCLPYKIFYEIFIRPINKWRDGFKNEAKCSSK